MSPLHDYEIDVGSIRATKKKTQKTNSALILPAKSTAKTKQTNCVHFKSNNNKLSATTKSTVFNRLED